MNQPDGPILYLASKSPRRQALLRALDLDFQILDLDVSEDYPQNLPARNVAKFLAEKKARQAMKLINDGIVITADSIVLLEEQVINKPNDRAEAREYLLRLSGRVHDVITGVCIAKRDKVVVFDCTTTVHFGVLTRSEIQYYVDTYLPLDKAGAYGIQEWIGHCKIDRIEGSFNNVMGLPTHMVYEALKDFGINRSVSLE